MTLTLSKVYDSFAETYEVNRGRFDMSKVLNNFYSELDLANGRLLDMGCGAGEPVARFFIDRGWSVVGVDFSKKMVKLASKYVPEMKTIHGDMAEVTFSPEQFNAIIASYSLFHLPASQHELLFSKFYQWLKPGGRTLFTYATEKYTGSDEFSGYKKFMEHELFYSHKTPADLYQQLQSVGFTLESADYHDIGGETFLWVSVSK